MAAIALRLVESLAAEPRRSELARICHWRAGQRWEFLELPRIRDRPYEVPEGGGVIAELPGMAHAPRDGPERDRGDPGVSDVSSNVR